MCILKRERGSLNLELVLIIALLIIGGIAGANYLGWKISWSYQNAGNTVELASSIETATPSVLGDVEVYTNETILGWSSLSLMDSITEEGIIGVDNGMFSTYVDFASGSAFPVDYMTTAETKNAAVMIAWEPWDSSVASTEQPAFRPIDIANGAYDAYITAWLTEAQTYADTTAVMVRFAPEMNDSVRPWSVGRNGGNTAPDYIAMWQHVYDIKESVAPDVIFVWNPLNYGDAGVTMAQVYPGSDYVDVLALDGFNWAYAHPLGDAGWQSYDDVFGAPIAEIKALANGKPWGIAEVGSAPGIPADFQVGGRYYAAWGSWVFDYPENPPYEMTPNDWITQEGWVKMLFLKAKADGALFVNLFNINKETDWRIHDSAEGIAAMQDVIASPTWVSGGSENASGYIKGALVTP